VPQLRRLVAGFPPLWSGFDPRSGHMGFVVDRMALGADFLRVFRFPLSILIRPTTPHSLIITSPTLCSLDTNSAVKWQKE
jgi:hypothetical protein